MTTPLTSMYGSLEYLGTQIGDPLNVELSPELVGLLSENLYQSPLKAIEELVVNAYDAAASECRVFVPEPEDSNPFVVVFDDGTGMDYDGLVDLWWIGRTKKRDVELEKRQGRKQIGKFGIGKLATYALANQITYISKSSKQILAVTVDFRAFSKKPGGATSQVELPVLKMNGSERLQDNDIFRKACEATNVDPEQLIRVEYAHVDLCDTRGFENKGDRDVKGPAALGAANRHATQPRFQVISAREGDRQLQGQLHSSSRVSSQRFTCFSHHILKEDDR